LQKHERTGRPAGNIQFIEKLEKSLGVTLKLKKTGAKTEEIGMVSPEFENAIVVISKSHILKPVVSISRYTVEARNSWKNRQCWFAGNRSEKYLGLLLLRC
jgi:hypothetical protein